MLLILKNLRKTETKLIVIKASKIYHTEHKNI